MFEKITALFKSNKPNLAQQYLEQNHIQWDEQQGYIVDGFVLNTWSERLEYFSNRRVKNFNDLAAIYNQTMIINEKIDLEMASGRYVERLGNNEENLRQMKQVIECLNIYYRQFVRDQK